MCKVVLESALKASREALTGIKMGRWEKSHDLGDRNTAYILACTVFNIRAGAYRRGFVQIAFLFRKDNPEKVEERTQL